MKLHSVLLLGLKRGIDVGWAVMLHGPSTPRPAAPKTCAGKKGVATVGTTVFLCLYGLRHG